MDTAAVERFEVNRDRLASLAYRLLGSAADAEDTVQDAFLRWQAADRERIRVPDAWLTRTVTNLALDRLRSARARRERAVAWLPEPLLDGDPMLGPADTAEQRESVTLAVLTLLERLPPVERAVYVLREAFSHSHAEIGAILDITEAASQQHASRARRHVAAARDRNRIDPASARRIVEAFVSAAASGHTERLVAMLTDDATAISDGAGLSRRLLRYPAPARIAAVLRAGFEPAAAKRRFADGTLSFHSGLVNGCAAVVAALDDRVVGLGVLELVGGRIATVHGIADPARLERLTRQWRRHSHTDPILVAR